MKHDATEQRVCGLDRLRIRALQGRGVSTIYKGSRRANYTVIQRSNKYEIYRLARSHAKITAT